MYSSFSTNTSEHFSCAISIPMQCDDLLVPLGVALYEPQSERQKEAEFGVHNSVFEALLSQKVKITQVSLTSCQ